MSPHAFIPPLRAPQRTIFIRTRRPWWQRLLPALVAFLALLALVLGTSALIARLHATDAQLQAAHQAGMAAGMQICPER